MSNGAAATWSAACRWWRTRWRTRCSSAIFVLLIAALLVMAADAGARVPRAAAAAAAGARARRRRRSRSASLALVGGNLTMASVAALPVLIGLAVDYAIQFQARFEECEPDGPGAGARRRLPRRRSAGPTIATRRPGDGGGLPRAAAVAGADGARLRRGAGARHRVRASLSRSPPASRRSCASARRGRPRGRAAAHAARRRAAPRLADRGHAPVRGARSARGLAGRCAGERGACGHRAAAARARWWACRSRCSAGRRTRRRKVISDVRELVPPEPARRCKDVNDAAERHRRVRRDRRDRARQGPHRPERGQLDDRVPGAACWRRTATRTGDTLHPGEGTRPSSARRCRCPTCSAPPTRTSAGTGQRLLDAVPALLLPGRDLAGPQDGEPGVRHPADAARPQKKVIDDIKRQARPAAGRDRATWWACRCWRPRPTASSSSTWRRALSLLLGACGGVPRAADRRAAACARPPCR